MKQLFSEGFVARDIAEPLLSFDADSDAAAIGKQMERDNVSVAGIRERGVLIGYVLQEALGGGTCRDHLRAFEDDGVLHADAPLADVIESLVETERCFMRLLGQVVGVITRDDLQKPSVRMWLFGMITIIEMFITRKIEELYPDEGWREFLRPKRLEMAEALFEERVRRGRHTRLIECLHLVDKAAILIRDPEAREEFDFGSGTQARRNLKHLESLRNNLAHAQDIVAHDWPAIVALARRIDRIVTRI